MVSTIIDVVPITYSQTIFEFLKEKEVIADTNALLEAVSEQKMGTLRNYIGGYDFLPLKKRLLWHTKIGDLFKKKQAISFSAVLFEPDYQLAVVKRFNMAKKTAARYNLSALFILQKGVKDRKIIGMLKQKFSSDSGR